MIWFGWDLWHINHCRLFNVESSLYIYIEYKTATCFETVLDAKPDKTAAVRPLTSYLSNYPSKRNKTCRALLEKQGRTSEWVSLMNACPVGWGCRTHRLPLCRRTVLNERPGNDTKQCDGDVPVMLELWGMRSTTLLSSLPSPHWPGVLASDRALYMGQIELNCVLILNWIVWNRNVFVIETELTLNWIVWIRTVWLNWIALNRNVFDD